MPLRKILAAGGLTVVALAIGGLLPVYAQSPTSLSGQVASAEEGPMEGVLVSAKRQGSTITVTVVSDAKGEFAFPAGRLEPGAGMIPPCGASYRRSSSPWRRSAAYRTPFW